MDRVTFIEYMDGICGVGWKVRDARTFVVVKDAEKLDNPVDRWIIHFHRCPIAF